MPAGTRIALIHALRDSMPPIWDAFAAEWSDAQTFNLLDDSLSADLTEEGSLTQSIIDRFLTLGRYAAQTGVGNERTKAILFTCSAFGPAIDAVKRDLDIPVLTPNEAAFSDALKVGKSIGLIVTFPPSEPALKAELQALADGQGKEIRLVSVVESEALSALQAGDGATHDNLIAEAARTISDVDCIVLGQFSMARAAKRLSSHVDVPVITTPAAAVLHLYELLNS